MPQLAAHRLSDAGIDRWATAFFGSILSCTLSTGDFEEVVHDHWRRGDFILRAPRTASWLRLLAARQARRDAHYAHDMPHLGFRSQWLVGVPGQPGAIHIEAPREQCATGALRHLNRPPHQHDSGRIALVTCGSAVFHVKRDDAKGTPAVVDCAVEPGDMICWPAWTPHTFNARQGFSVVSAMARYVAPDDDGFVFPAPDNLDDYPRRSYPSPRT